MMISRVRIGASGNTPTREVIIKPATRIPRSRIHRNVGSCIGHCLWCLWFLANQIDKINKCNYENEKQKSSKCFAHFYFSRVEKIERMRRNLSRYVCVFFWFIFSFQTCRLLILSPLCGFQTLLLIPRLLSWFGWPVVLMCGPDIAYSCQ